MECLLDRCFFFLSLTAVISTEAKNKGKNETLKGKEEKKKKRQRLAKRVSLCDEASPRAIKKEKRKSQRLETEVEHRNQFVSDAFPPFCCCCFADYIPQAALLSN